MQQVRISYRVQVIFRTNGMFSVHVDFVGPRHGNAMLDRRQIRALCPRPHPPIMLEKGTLFAITAAVGREHLKSRDGPAHRQRWRKPALCTCNYIQCIYVCTKRTLARAANGLHRWTDAGDVVGRVKAAVRAGALALFGRRLAPQSCYHAILLTLPLLPLRATNQTTQEGWVKPW